MVPDYDGVYFYEGNWYRFYNNYWFRSSHYNGGWDYIEQSMVPQVIFVIPPEYIHYVPSGYYRIHYNDFYGNWRTWDHKNGIGAVMIGISMRGGMIYGENGIIVLIGIVSSGVSRLFKQQQQGRQQHDVQKPQQHDVQRPQQPAVQKPQQHDVQRPQQPAVQKPQQHDVQRPQQPLFRNPSSMMSRDRSSQLSRNRSSMMSKDRSSQLSRNRSSMMSRDPSSQLSRNRSSMMSKDPNSLLSRNPSSMMSKDPNNLLSRNPSSLLPRNRSSNKERRNTRRKNEMPGACPKIE